MDPGGDLLEAHAATPLGPHPKKALDRFGQRHGRSSHPEVCQPAAEVRQFSLPKNAATMPRKIQPWGSRLAKAREPKDKERRLW